MVELECSGNDMRKDDGDPWQLLHALQVGNRNMLKWRSSGEDEIASLAWNSSLKMAVRFVRIVCRIALSLFFCGKMCCVECQRRKFQKDHVRDCARLTLQVALEHMYTSTFGVRVEKD